jgi:EAL domain-containing protein (putative c-di-GMP-specific phosphodiesterase class I)
VDLSRVTVEIVEQDRGGEVSLLLANLIAMRRAGASIALDNVGLGYSNYQMMLDCAPDFLKVDRYLVTGCDRDLRRRAILDSVFLLGARLGARVVAEGVESLGELEFLTSLGLELFQGFLLCRPIPAVDLRLGADSPALPGSLSPLFLRERPLDAASLPAKLAAEPMAGR